jgi:hypothetical protein
MEPLPQLTGEDVVQFIRNDPTMQREMLQKMIIETIIEFRKKQQALKGIVLDEFNPQVRESAAEEARRLLEEGLTFGDLSELEGGKSRKSKTRKHKSRKHKSRKHKSRKH